MIKIDGGAAEVYNEEKEYYALRTVEAYCTYTDEESQPARTGSEIKECPANDYDVAKPFAVFIYQYGYNDSGAGQEDGASSRTSVLGRMNVHSPSSAKSIKGNR